MTSVSHDCPFCGTKNAAFELIFSINSRVSDVLVDCLGRCSSCHQVGLIRLRDKEVNIGRTATRKDPINFGQEKPIISGFDLVRLIPSPPKPQIATDLPANVENSMKEAELAFASGIFGLAGAGYRKALERGVKRLTPDSSSNLFGRIKELRDSGSLPTEMIDLLNEVRLFGNDAIHEEDYEPTKQDCEQAREFCHLFFTYCFSLPAKIEVAKNIRERN